MTTAARPRMLFIDNLRVFLITMIVLLHLAVTYGGAGDWHYQEFTMEEAGLLAGVVFSLFTMTVIGFSVGCFFMIAGYFTPGSCDRKGRRRFLIDRLLRLGIPLVFYIIVFDPVIKFTVERIAEGSDLSFGGFLGMYLGSYHALGSGPMWFVMALLMFTVVYLIWQMIGGAIGYRFESSGRVPGNLAVTLFAVAVGTVTFVIRIWLPVGWQLDIFNFQIPFFTQYISMFVVGLVAYRGRWFERLTDRQGFFWLGVMIVLLLVNPVVIFLGGATEDSSVFQGGMVWQSFYFSVWEQFICVGVIAGVSVVFRRWFDYQGRLLKSLSASAYTVYFIHPVIIIGTALSFRGLELHPLIKFAIVAPISLVLCFSLATVIRKLPLAREIL